VPPGFPNVTSLLRVQHLRRRGICSSVLLAGFLEDHFLIDRGPSSINPDLFPLPPVFLGLGERVSFTRRSEATMM